MSDPEIGEVSDSERDAVVERLRAASIGGWLTPEELISRTEAAYGAQTRDELARMISDLPEQSSSTTHIQDKWPLRIFTLPDRSGWQRVGGRIIARPWLLGGFEFDLSGAVVPPDAEQVKCAALFGEIEIIVPDRVSVELTGFTLFGRRQIDVRESDSIGPPPVLRVRAFTIFGSVLVRN
ncbi:hypothetical protein Aph01nite_64460 [Acrocarpospora phusangensis]|uniref:Cell wall-active antibiotics response LiaF-like C-terminal domain-containing protein n=1 Tax=Acrocarpospora phusangensis TaxID=1070424 RepID=A0A919QFZ0_9ACTN|nr:DUF1707 domain-containing protein [Acrocarpospora phusangensis]GIH28136.1 hypothetical protein Aph01nite_64460 [Acrocarpospora phusangensis]